MKSVDNYGTVKWRLNNKLHREDGPAVEYKDGSTHWYLDGLRHRVDGPAIENANGYRSWWLHGKQLDPIVHFIKAGEMS